MPDMPTSRPLATRTSGRRHGPITRLMRELAAFEEGRLQ
jgi:hypothetical protein